MLLKWAETLTRDALKTGPIPEHVAFIMDGNRRWADQHKMERHMGHTFGYKKLEQTLQWCLELGVQVVTVYAFSLENFKRSEEEVSALMHMANEKFSRFVEEKGIVEKYGVAVRVLGDWTRLSPDLQHTMARAVYLSRHNTKAVLNVCVAYTARDEIAHAVRCAARGVQDGILLPRDVTEELLERCLFTYQCPDPDILVRTSGETRLSDFLLWQTAFSLIMFQRVLWPEFSIWHLFVGVFRYQMAYAALKEAKRKYRAETAQRQKGEDLAYLRTISAEQPRASEHPPCNGYAMNGHSGEHSEDASLMAAYTRYIADRMQRQERFLSKHHADVDAFIDRLFHNGPTVAPQLAL